MELCGAGERGRPGPVRTLLSHQLTQPKFGADIFQAGMTTISRLTEPCLPVRLSASQKVRPSVWLAAGLPAHPNVGCSPIRDRTRRCAGHACSCTGCCLLAVWEARVLALPGSHPPTSAGMYWHFNNVTRESTSKCFLIIFNFNN